MFVHRGQEAEYVQWGSLIPLSYTVTNTGTGTATGVTLNLTQASDSHLLTIVSATTTLGSIDPGLTFAEPPQSFATIGTLAPASRPR